MKRFFVAFATPLVLAASVAVASAQGTVQTISFTPASPVAPGTNVAVTVTASNPCGAIGIEYGDGASSVYPISALPLTQTHVYPNAGTFTVRATGHGNCSGQITRTLVVSDPAPPPPPAGAVSAIAANPVSALTGANITFAVSGTNPCPAFRIQYGDGSSSNHANVSLPFSTTRSYGNPGAYTVRAFGTGGCGGLATTQVTVAAPPPPPPPPPPNRPQEDAGVGIVDDLTIQSVDQSPTGEVRTNGNVRYSVAVRNGGNRALSQVVVRLALARYAWTAQSNGVGTGCSVTRSASSGSEVTCTIASMGAGTTTTLDMRLVTPATFPASEGFQDFVMVEARVDPDNAIRETSETNNTGRTLTRLVKLPDLDPDGSRLPQAADATNVFYPVVMRNIGEGRADNPVLRIVLPLGFVVVRVQDTNATCTTSAPPDPRETGEQIRCRITNLLPGEELKAQIVARTTGTELDGRLALLTLRADPDDAIVEASETNNTAAVSTTLSVTSDLQIVSHTIRFDPLFDNRQHSCKIGADTSIEVRIRNNGPAATTATELRVQFAPGVILGGDGHEDCPPGTGCFGGTCITPGPCRENCPVPRLLAGQEYVARFRMRRPSDLDNFGTATLPLNRNPPESNENNNSRTLRRAGSRPQPLSLTLGNLVHDALGRLGLRAIAPASIR